jgi:hypothetical protein
MLPTRAPRISRYYKFLPGEQQQAFLENLREKAS